MTANVKLRQLNLQVPIAPPIAKSCTSLLRNLRCRCCDPAVTACIEPISVDSVNFGGPFSFTWSSVDILPFDFQTYLALKVGVCDGEKVRMHIQLVKALILRILHIFLYHADLIHFQIT